jgi:arylsulfatase
MPKSATNLRTDPYEFADVTSNTYYDWMIHHAYLIFAAQSVAGQFIETFKDSPCPLPFSDGPRP